MGYNGELAVQDLKSFCQEHLPRFSKRVDPRHFEFPSVTSEKLPSYFIPPKRIHLLSGVSSVTVGCIATASFYMMHRYVISAH